MSVCFSTFEPRAFINSGLDPDCQDIPSWVSENKRNYGLFSQRVSHVKKKLKNNLTSSLIIKERVCVCGLTDLRQILDQLSETEKNNGLKLNKSAKNLIGGLSEQIKQVGWFVVCCEEAGQELARSAVS